MGNNNTKEKYILVKLSDAKLIAQLVQDQIVDKRSPYRYVYDDIEKGLAPLNTILKRFKEEEGADVENIVKRLKGMDFCPACVIESQQRTCCCLDTQKLGRRLKRLVDRANGIVPSEVEEQPAPVKAEVVSREYLDYPGYYKTPQTLDEAQVFQYQWELDNLQILRRASFLRLEESVQTVMKGYLLCGIDENMLGKMAQVINDITEHWRASHKGVWQYPNGAPCEGKEFYFKTEELSVGNNQNYVTLTPSPDLLALSEGNAAVKYNVKGCPINRYHKSMMEKSK